MAFFVSGAIIGSAVLGAGASIYASNKQSEAAGNALNFQQHTFDTNQKNMRDAQGVVRDAQGSVRDAQGTLQPYLDIGKNATYTLGQLTGTGNNGQQDYSSFFKDPSYGFAQQQGELGIERGANARGLNLSGGTLKDLASFNSGLASQQYGNYFNRLMRLAGIGQNATNTNAGLVGTNANLVGTNANLVTGNASNNTTSAGQVGNTMMGQGQAQASGAVGIANAANGGVSNSLMAAYMNRNPSGYGTGDAYGGGGAWGGSSANPLPGLNASDYGKGY